MPDVMQVALDRRARLKRELARIESFILTANALLADERPEAERRIVATHEIAPGVVRIAPRRYGSGMEGGDPA